jgi:hypothetical protein
VPPRDAQLTEFEQCAVGSEQYSKLHRRHAMMVGYAKEERDDGVRGTYRAAHPLGLNRSCSPSNRPNEF